MRTLLRFLLVVSAICALVILHLFLRYTLPHPFDQVNILFAICILLIAYKESGVVVWLAFFSHFIIELYTTLPYGITLASATLSIMIGFWLYQHIFTNRSFGAMILLTMLIMALYRSFFLLFVGVTTLFSNFVITGMRGVLMLFGWELLWTTALVSIFSLVLLRQFSEMRTIQKTPYDFS